MIKMGLCHEHRWEICTWCLCNVYMLCGLSPSFICFNRKVKCLNPGNYCLHSIQAVRLRNSTILNTHIYSSLNSRNNNINTYILYLRLIHKTVHLKNHTCKSEESVSLTVTAARCLGGWWRRVAGQRPVRGCGAAASVTSSPPPRSHHTAVGGHTSPHTVPSITSHSNLTLLGRDMQSLHCSRSSEVCWWQWLWREDGHMRMNNMTILTTTLFVGLIHM